MTSAGVLGGLGGVLEGLGGPSALSCEKKELGGGSLTPPATFFGTPFWTRFEPWAHFFHLCSIFWLKNINNYGCVEFCIDFLSFRDVHPEAKSFKSVINNV